MTCMFNLLTGSMLAQRKVNVKNFVREFNDRTAKMKKGVPLPTRTLATSDKDFELEIDHPPMEFFIKQAAGITVGAVKGETAGYISLKHVYEIAKIKQEDLPNVMKSMEELCNEVIKAARCCGVLVVPRLDPIEYEQFLQERKKFLAKHRAEIQAALDAKAAKE